MLKRWFTLILIVSIALGGVSMPHTAASIPPIHITQWHPVPLPQPVQLQLLNLKTPTVAVKGKHYTVHSMGIASWYGEQHQGLPMANGHKFDRHKLTAASWYYPFGTRLRVTNLKNGKSVIVTITDRGPNLRLHRVLDLSEAAAAHLDYVRQGLAPVFMCPLVPAQTQSARFDVGLTSPRG